MDIVVKKEIVTQLANTLKPHAGPVLGSPVFQSTKLIPVTLKGYVSTFSVYIFNPLYRMSLCELTPTIFSDEQMQVELKEYPGQEAD